MLSASPITPVETREERQCASEIKFLLSPEQALGVREWARKHLDADPHADSDADQYRVTSLYFDTPAFDVYQRNGSFGRAKYRIRRYGDSPSVFLERKLKTRDVVSKRRSLVEIPEMAALKADTAEYGEPGFWFHRRMIARRLSPVCAISYLRTARVASNPLGPIRLTVDQDLRAAQTGEFAFSDSFAAGGGANLTGNRNILELKYRYQMPVLFKQLVERFGLVQQPLSKYRLAVKHLGLAPDAGGNNSNG